MVMFCWAGGSEWVKNTVRVVVSKRLEQNSGGRKGKEDEPWDLSFRNKRAPGR